MDKIIEMTLDGRLALVWVFVACFVCAVGIETINRSLKGK